MVFKSGTKSKGDSEYHLRYLAAAARKEYEERTNTEGPKHAEHQGLSTM
jgi:hypothetical protein